MANEKLIDARVQHRHDTEANWLKSVYKNGIKENDFKEHPLTPMQAEIIIFDKDENYDYERFKIGDGVTNVIDLPFADEEIIKKIENLESNTVSLKNGEAKFSVIQEGDDSVNNYGSSVAYAISGTAFGDGTVAGSKGFRITSYDVGSRTYTLDIGDYESLETAGYAIGDIFSIYLKTTLDNFGKILALNGNVVTVDNFVKLPSGSEPGTTSGDSYLASSYFRVADKPTIGTLNVGTGAHSEGINTKALATAAHSEGYNNITNGKYAHTEGRNNVANYAAHAEGHNNNALGYRAHAEGSQTKALANAAHSEGFQTVVGMGWIKIENFDKENNQLTLSDVSKFAINDEFSVFEYSKSNYLEHTNYINIGKITAIDTASNIIVVDKFSVAMLSDKVYYFGVLTKPDVVPYAEGGAADTLMIDYKVFGNYAHVEGYNNTVTGEAAHGEGYSNIVSGNYAHGEGFSNKATGRNSHVEGEKNIANGNASHAEGILNIAEGEGANASGYNTEAKGISSHTEGYKTIAEGNFAHSEGEGSTATGIASHSEGYYTKATAPNSHAEGSNSVAEGNYSHAEGNATHAQGINSHSEGNNTYAENKYAHSEGANTHAQGEGSHAEGSNTYAKKSYSHSEGVNTTADGYGGHTEGLETSVTGAYGHAEGESTKVTSTAGHAEGKGTQATGYGAHAEGNATLAKGNYSHAEGSSSKALGEISHASGSGSAAVGKGAEASGDKTYAFASYAHTEGGSSAAYIGELTDDIDTVNGNWNKNFHAATGLYGHAEGYNNLTSGTFGHTEGAQNKASGTASHAEGMNTEASGADAHAEGYLTTASGDYSHAGGEGTRATGKAQTVEGRYNKEIEDAYYIVGNGESNYSRSNAFVVYKDGRAEIGKAPENEMDVVNKGYIDNNATAVEDVTELPTENIKTNKIYNLFTAIFIHNRHVVDNSRCYIVNSLPETGEPATNLERNAITAYYDLSDSKVYGYLDETLAAGFSQLAGATIIAGWYPAEQLLPIAGWSYAGVIDHISKDPNDSTIRVLLEKKVYIYNNEWIELTNSIVDEKLPTPDANGHFAYTVQRRDGVDSYELHLISHAINEAY